MTDLHGNEPLVFDYEAAGQLVTAATAAAQAMRDQQGARASAVSTALTDFSGHYADLFRDNAAVAKADGVQIAVALDGLATVTKNLIAAAHAEDDRRSKARDWYKHHDGTWDHIRDSIFGGGGKPPEGPQDPPATELPTIPKNSPRRTSGHGAGGSTSSARPANLKSFATSTASLDTGLQQHQSKVESLLHTFNQNTVWGQLDGYVVTTAMGTWLSANANDQKFATTVATAFAHAGGDGGLSTLSNSAIGAALKAAGVTTIRSDLDVEMPQTYGFDETTGYSLDPVNTATGNFIESETDLGFAGGAELALTRMYNSMSLEQGAFGYGWSSLAEAGLAIDEEQARFTLADGRVVIFPRLGDGWDRPVSDNLWLATLEDGSHRITGNDGSWWSCAADGRLTAYGAGPGTTVTLAHAEGRLVEIAHERGRSIRLTWQGDRIASAQTSDGRVAAYSYDEQGHLLSVTAPGADRTYRWDTAEHLITAVVDADGVLEAENTYDEKRRVRTQLTQHGRRVRFTYLPGRLTVIDDEDGTNANTWIADAKGRLIGVIDSEGHRQSSAFDARGNLVVVTERDGATTVHEYDDRGRRTRTVTPSGADLQYAYDELDRVTTVVTEADAVTAFTYQGEERSPATITDPEGGTTRLTWDAGLLRRLVGPTGVTVTFDYDEHGALIAATDADGNTARLEYDAAGRVTAAITPLGHRTSYGYDERGLLAQRIDPDGAVWTFEHTAGGRLTATTDPTGARTVIEHDPAGEASLLIDPLGRRTEVAHDDFGNLAAVTLPDGRTWTYAHDSLSRPVAVTSPDGGVWATTFDANGAPVGFSDPTGVAVDLRVDRLTGAVSAGGAGGAVTLAHDLLGRLIRVTGVDGCETVAGYDRCGRVVESIDAEGGLTRFRYDPAGRLIAATSPSGGTTTYEWDHCGRLVASTDPAGARTSFAYDADRRLTRITMPTGETAEITYDACGRVVSRRVPGVGSSRISYDAAGRIVEIRDPVNGRRRFGYDAAGQLVAAIDGNGAATRYEYDLLGRAVTITDPLGAVTRREFDSLNQCVAETDPLGRTTRAGYDAAGRQVWQESADGRRTEWTYDAAGRVDTISVDGIVQSEFQRDLRARRLTVVDHTDPAHVCTHELAWNGRRQLIERRRDGQGLRWTYDADGRRTSMTTPDGHTTSYSYDAAGRLHAIEHPLFGRVSFDHDASGRLVAATAGDLMQTWEYVDGFLSAHSVTTGHGVSRTTVARDETGRITSLDRDGETTAFTHDDAGQLIAAVTGGTEIIWRYDAAGRLVAETADGVRTEHTYDAAGQLLATASAGRVVSYGYDALGRRTSATVDGTTTTYAWNAMGWLAGLADGAGTEHTLHVDALGELAAVDGVQLFHDSASWRGDLVRVGEVPVLPVGAVTGIGSVGWTAPGWRTARGTTPSDPWALPHAFRSLGGLPAGLGIGTGGELSIGGLEWMNARVYDPASRGFLSVDPLDPVTGAAWAGNRYSYAGNDPLHALDPLGLRPATDQDLTDWANSHQGTVVGRWLKSNWEYVAAGAMVAAGVVLLATSVVDGPLGVALGSGLISAGIDAGVQKATTGGVNWREVALSGAVGAIGGGGSAVLVSSIRTAGMSAGRAIVTNVGVNAGVGAIVNAGNEMTSELIAGKGLHPGAIAANAFGGALSGGMGGLAGPAGGTFAREAAASAGQSVAGATTSTMAKVAAGGVNFAAGAIGQASTDLLQGKGWNPGGDLIAGATNVGGGVVADRAHVPSPNGMNSLEQSTHFTPRPSHVLSSSNGQKMIYSAAASDALGDLMQDSIG